MTDENQTLARRPR